MHTNIRADILSGITVAIIALPLALAFGEISQLGPVAGIWGAIAGGIIGGLFGGCMVGVSGPTAPKAAQIATFMSLFIIGSTDKPDLVAAFSIIFLSGIVLVFISLLKISRFIHLTPYSVIAGFMCGIGVIVILTQINAFLGLEAEKNIHSVFQNFSKNLKNANPDALFVALPSLFILFSWSRLEQKVDFLKNIPSPLVALIAGTSIASIMGLNIPYIGDKMGGAKEAEIFSLYVPDLTRLSEFIIPALALAGLAILDSLLSCKVADNMTGEHHSSDKETFGQGMANIAAGLVGGVTTATATMRTVANIKFGGKTPLASIVHGLTLLAILLGLGFLVEAIPTACLAAILFKVGIDIMDYRILPIIKKLPNTDLIVFIIVLFVTVYEDLMVAVAIGVIFAVLKSLNQIKSIVKSNFKHKIISLQDSKYSPKKMDDERLNKLPVLILQPHGPLFFASIEKLIQTYSKIKEHELLIVDLDKVTMIDLSGVFSLEDLIIGARKNGIKVFVTNASSNVNNVLSNLGFIRKIGSENYNRSYNAITSFINERFNINIS
tara:strand:- start:5020 stop:6672 length:1653 start_codon:yes stop_codon:yes gene_type:complete